MIGTERSKLQMMHEAVWHLKSILKMRLHISAITFKCNSFKRISVQLTDTFKFSLKSGVITDICQRLGALRTVLQAAEELQQKATAAQLASASVEAKFTQKMYTAAFISPNRIHWETKELPATEREIYPGLSNLS